MSDFMFVKVPIFISQPCMIMQLKSPHMLFVMFILRVRTTLAKSRFHFCSSYTNYGNVFAAKATISSFIVYLIALVWWSLWHINVWCGPSWSMPVQFGFLTQLRTSTHWSLCCSVSLRMIAWKSCNGFPFINAMSIFLFVKSTIFSFSDYFHSSTVRSTNIRPITSSINSCIFVNAPFFGMQFQWTY